MNTPTGKPFFMTLSAYFSTSAWFWLYISSIQVLYCGIEKNTSSGIAPEGSKWIFEAARYASFKVLPAATGWIFSKSLVIVMTPFLAENLNGLSLHTYLPFEETKSGADWLE